MDPGGSCGNGRPLNIRTRSATSAKSFESQEARILFGYRSYEQALCITEHTRGACAPRKLEVSASYTCLSLMWGILASHILEAQPVSAWVGSEFTNCPRASGFRGPQNPCLGAQVPLKSGCSRTVEFPATPKTHSGTTSPHNPLQITKIDRCEESPSHAKV